MNELSRITTISTYDTKFSTRKLVVICLVLTALLSGGAAYWSYLWGLGEINHTAKERLELYSGIFASALNRERYLPSVVADNPKVISLVETWEKFQKKQAELQDWTLQKYAVSTWLQDLQRQSFVSGIYILDKNGLSIASSNWNNESSSLGKSFGTRPYFLDARYGFKSGYIVIEYNNGQPEYYLSAPIKLNNKTVAVVATRTNLKPLQDQWLRGTDTVIVTDEFGVAVLTSNKAWRYGELTRLPRDALEEYHRKKRRYKDFNLKPLTPTDLRLPGVKSMKIGLKNYYFHSGPLSDLRWKIYYLTPEDAVTRRIWVSAIIAAICGVVLLLLVLLRKQRRIQQFNKSRLAAAERINQMNKQLEAQVAERIRAETELRTLQEELIQSGKLSALGNMAAVMAHEINQPITGLKMSMFNARKLLMRRQSVDMVLPIFSEMESLTDRMRRITEQLKAFARKEPITLKQFDARDVINESLKLVTPTADKNECEISVELGEDPLLVEADSGRLEQVIVNLVNNAVDAMKASDERKVTISAKAEGSDVLIYVRDTGTGIPEDQIAHIFEPFYTTKSAGEGIGLGLAISRRIIEHFDGSLSIVSSEQKGACFEIKIPAPESVESAKAVAI